VGNQDEGSSYNITVHAPVPLAEHRPSTDSFIRSGRQRATRDTRPSVSVLGLIPSDCSACLLPRPEVLDVEWSGQLDGEIA
jgi:hypothetical protein